MTMFVSGRFLSNSAQTQPHECPSCLDNVMHAKHTVEVISHPNLEAPCPQS